jgi:hypothetical protein
MAKWRLLKFPFCDYKGRRITLKNGRKYIHMINLITGKHRITSFARYLVSVYLKRFLLKTEVVDHKDEDKTNDRLSNYQILTSNENIRKSARLRYGFIIREIEQACLVCGKSFFAEKFKKTCTTSCKREYLSKSGCSVSRCKSSKIVQRIKRLRKLGGTSYSIAASLRISRNTVMKYW